MKVAKVSIIAAAVLAVATVAYAQKPDFSGSWAPDAAAAGGGGGGRGGGGPMMVKQTADTLTVERSMGDNKVTQTYKLDGSESKNQMMGRGGGAPVEAISTAKWDGAALVITTKRPGQDGAMQETTAKWSLAGDVLTIENTSARGTNKTTYKKST